MDISIDQLEKLLEDTEKEPGRRDHNKGKNALLDPSWNSKDPSGSHKDRSYANQNCKVPNHSCKDQSSNGLSLRSLRSLRSFLFDQIQATSVTKVELII